jgi:hypothetical protein
MISEAAYYLAQKRGFLGKHALDDWLAAEQQVRQAISPLQHQNVSPFEKQLIMPNQPKPSEIVSVDDTIDAIAREALAEARRIEEAQRYRHNPGPLGPPRSGHVVETLTGEERY